MKTTQKFCNETTTVRKSELEEVKSQLCFQLTVWSWASHKRMYFEHLTHTSNQLLAKHFCLTSQSVKLALELWKQFGHGSTYIWFCSLFLKLCLPPSIYKK